MDDSRPNDNGNITDMANFGVWDNSLGSETLQVWVVSDLEALTDYTFSFEVVNPAEGQTAPALSAVAIGIPAASFSPTGRRLLDHEGEGSPAMTVAFLNYDENLISQVTRPLFPPAPIPPLCLHPPSPLGGYALEPTPQTGACALVRPQRGG